MRCFSCDRLVSGDDYDKPTGRWYCSECFQFTADEMLSLEKKERGYVETEVEYVSEKESLERFFDEATEEEGQEMAENLFYGEYDE